MKSIFILIYPLKTDESKWLNWRETIKNALKSETTIIPEKTCSTIISEASNEHIKPEFLCINTQLHGLQHKISAFLDEDDLKPNVTCWIFSSKPDGPSIVVDIEYNSKAPTPHEVREKIDSKLFQSQNTLKITEADAALKLQTVFIDYISEIDHKACQIVSFFESDHEIEDTYLAAHFNEEGNSQNMAVTLEAPDHIIKFARMGWSYSTFVLKDISDAKKIYPIAIKSQCEWFLMHCINNSLLEQDHLAHKKTKSSTNFQIKKYSNLKLEFHLWKAEQEAFSHSLVPWRARIHKLYAEKWNTNIYHDRNTKLIEHISEMLSSAASGFERKDQNNQSKMLAAITIIQLLGLAGGITGYIQLTQEAHIDINDMIHNTLFQGFVITLPLITSATIAFLLFFVFKNNQDR